MAEKVVDIEKTKEIKNKEAETTAKKKKFTIMVLSIWRILAYFIIYMQLT